MRDDGALDDQTRVPVPGIPNKSVTRGAFRFHPGSISLGCLTVKEKKQWKEIEKALLGTKTATIPGTNIIYSGTVTVK